MVVSVVNHTPYKAENSNIGEYQFSNALKSIYTPIEGVQNYKIPRIIILYRHKLMSKKYVHTRYFNTVSIPGRILQEIFTTTSSYNVSAMGTCCSRRFSRQN